MNMQQQITAESNLAKELKLEKELKANSRIQMIRKAAEKVEEEEKTERVESKREELNFDKINNDYTL